MVADALRSSRHGTVLIIVVGLAALLLSSYLVIAAQLRTDATDGQILLRDAQARIMLPSALGFIIESARLGQVNGQECFGWTDLRDGGAGPRGPAAADGSLPPEVPAGRWPGLGSVFRADLAMFQRPPCAVQLTRAYNPVAVPENWLQDYERAVDPATTLLAKIIDPVESGDRTLGAIPPNPPNTSSNPDSWYWTEERDPWRVPTDLGLGVHWGRAWSEIVKPMDEFQPRFHQALTPQPVANTFTEHLAGDLTPRPESVGRSWFRVRRLAPAQYDGNPGDAWFDSVPLTGYGVFLITCGAGGTRGFRDWAEVQSENAEDIFLGDRQFFEQLRATERLLWFRCEWSGFIGGGVDVAQRYSAHHGHLGSVMVSFTRLHTQAPTITGASRLGNRIRQPLNSLGTIRFIERLEGEPTDGSTPGQGNPLW